MFERFTDRARRVMVLAYEESRFLNHNYVGTEHILLGLLHEGEGVAAKALESLGVTLQAVRQEVGEIIGHGQQAPSGRVPFTPSAKKVLELSLREAMQLGHNYIGTEHILLGLTHDNEGVAGHVLVKLGADSNRVRQQVIQRLLPLAGLGARTGDDSLLDREADARRAEVTALPADAPDRWERMARLGSCLMDLFERVGDSDLLTEAATTYRSALRAIPTDSKLAARAHEISFVMDDFRERTGDGALLGVQVEADRAAAAAVPEADPGRPLFLYNLGVSLLLLAEQAGDAEARDLLAEAVDVSRESFAPLRPRTRHWRIA